MASSRGLCNQLPQSRAGRRDASPAATPRGGPGTATSSTVRDRAASALGAGVRPTARAGRAGSAQMGFSAATQPRVSPLPTREMKTQDSKGAARV